MKAMLLLLALWCFPVVALAQAPASQPSAAAPAQAPVRWAIAIHGGAGVISKSMPEETKREYFASLEAALKVGRDALAAGGTSLDVVEKVVRVLEDDPKFNAGKGAVFTSEGTHELDAAIMDGRTLGCGSVAALKTIKNPIALARLVMERSPHVFMVGEGAERFADEMKVEKVPNEYFSTPRRRQQWQEEQRKVREKQGKPEEDRDTVGAVALDVHGNLAAATSTGGTTNKRFGRLGDVPVIGAGTYANNRTCAVSATGIGEQFIRHTVAHDISAMMEYASLPLQQAAERVIGKLKPGDGGVIAVGRDGSLALVFNSEGMFRGAADSTGRFEVAIWE